MKRAVDVLFSLLALLLLAPVMILVACLVALKLGRPVLFVQQRPGFDAAPFYMYKFRSMKDAVDPRGNPLPDSERLTRFGSLLRRTSLDELPGFINILKGDMSLVGPRPLLMEYLPLYSDEQKRRHNVRPGITGWAQVNGRNAISWQQKFEFDVWYVDNASFWLDLKIILLTVNKVFQAAGISQDGEATMRKFTGNE